MDTVREPHLPSRANPLPERSHAERTGDVSTRPVITHSSHPGKLSRHSSSFSRRHVAPATNSLFLFHWRYNDRVPCFLFSHTLDSFFYPWISYDTDRCAHVYHRESERLCPSVHAGHRVRAYTFVRAWLRSCLAACVRASVSPWVRESASPWVRESVSPCVRACVRACVSACVRECVRGYVRARTCVYVCLWLYISREIRSSGASSRPDDGRTSSGPDVAAPLSCAARRVLVGTEGRGLRALSSPPFDSPVLPPSAARSLQRDPRSPGVGSSSMCTRESESIR